MSTEPFTSLVSTAVLLPVDDIDTDQIIPARFLKTTDRNGLGEHLFADWRYDASGGPRVDFALNAARAREAKVLVTGRNFGCGSSREHAAWALRAFGFRVVISTSFADIFRSNALSNGMLPLLVRDSEHAAIVRTLVREPTAPLSIDLPQQEFVLLTADGLRCTFPIEPFAKRCLLHGVDHLGYLLEARDEIAAYETSRPACVCTTC